MLYVLKNNEKQAPWQLQYEGLFERELTALGIPVINAKMEDLGSLTPHDYLWVMHYKDLLSPAVAKTKAQVISHSNATTANPYIYQLPMVEEMNEMADVIDIVLTFSERQTKAMRKIFPKKKYVEVGFPIEVPALDCDHKIPKTVIVPGRISPDKQFYLTVFLLEPLIKEGFEITFVMQDTEKNRFWLNLYDQMKFDYRSFKFMWADRDAFLQKAAVTQYVFMASLGDIMAVSLAEACMLKCYPVIPKFDDGLPCYDEYITNGYEPFSRKEVFRFFIARPYCTFQQNWFLPPLCAKKLVTGLSMLGGNL